jgi:hypothetical protein
MGISPGEKVNYRIMPEMTRYDATVVSSDDESVVLKYDVDSHDAVANGRYLIVEGAEVNFYTEVVKLENGAVHLKRMWSERRGYFRVDDVIPILSKKVEDDAAYGKSKIISGYAVDFPETGVPEETIHPQLWKMLSDINIKLALILEKLDLEAEGLAKAESMPVNVSATGIRFTLKEKVEIGSTVEVKMLLPTSPPVGVVAYGHVVRVKDLDNGKYEVALHFSDMDDEVRDEIIQYALDRQREIIRKQRNQRGNDV